MADIPPARLSATVALLRDGSAPEVLMVRRSSTATLMPGGWVFPGGIVDPGDAHRLAVRVSAPTTDGLHSVRVAAIRELVEEVGVWLVSGEALPPAGVGASRPRGSEVFTVAAAAGVVLATDRLVHFANWITPTVVPQRFDTHFFAASAPSGAAPAPDDHEIDTVEWITPETAIERGRDGTWSMSPPTLGTLDDLSGHSSVHAILTALSAHTVAPVRPRVRIGEDSLDVVLPGEVGFDDLSDLPPDPSIAARLRQVARPRGSRDAG